ncbi:MAG: NADH-quinone oxidoreductase subunit NuoG [Roseiflexaceae bacterium]
MPDVNLIIDGQAVAVPPGTNIVEAARLAGVSIPVFCYHPKLKPVGMCRMCMVEVWTPKVDPATRQVVMGEDGKPVLALMMGKLQPGCVTPVSEGMEVRTKTEKVSFTQKGVLEFLLTSHPLDCPVCDKGGECPLQNLTMQWGPSNSRFDYSDKVHFEKPIPLGDLIYLDRERCILCSRCVRFEDDVAGDPVLGFNNRGRSWEIIAKGEPAFDSKFSGNTTDICPVGALTTADFRFKARVWELQSVPGVCNNCSVGCDLTLDTRHGQLKRVMPRENDFVNEIWLCDKGRFGMRSGEQPNRLKTPMIRRNGQLSPATWSEALGLIAEQFAAVREKSGGKAIGGLAGAGLSNEDFYLFGRLLREAFGSSNLDYRPGQADDPAVDSWSSTFGIGKGSNLGSLGKGAAVLIIAGDPEEEAPLYTLRVRGIQQRGGEITVINPYPTKLGKSANRSIQPKPGTGPQVVLALLKTLFDEGLAKAEARVQGLDALKAALASSSVEALCDQAGVDPEVVRSAARSFANAEHGVIIYGRLALSIGAALLDAVAAFAAAAGKIGRAGSGLIGMVDRNARGAIDMGVRPDAKSLSAFQMLSAGSPIKALFVAGSDPACDNPAAAKALAAMEFVVVQDTTLTATAEYASVVLPMVAHTEREGSFTNAERRVQRSRQALRPDGDIRAVWEVAQQVAELARESALVAANGKGGRGEAQPGWEYAVAEDVTAAIATHVRGYRAADLASLSAGNGTWGRQPSEQVYYDGTSYENNEGVGVQLASIADDGRSNLPVSVALPSGAAREGLSLIVAPRAYDNGQWGQGSKLAPRMVPAHVILSVGDAQALGVAIGEQVTITSAAGSVTLPAQVDAGLAAGVVLAPTVVGAGLGQVVTGAFTSVSISKAE